MASPRRITPLEAAISILASGILMLAAWRGWMDTSLVEAAGMATGTICVYLVVKEHLWNFPIGILSTVCYIVFFMQVRFYGDAGLQVVYLLLGIQGWYWWLRGGQQHRPLKVKRAPTKLLVTLGVISVPGTFVLWGILHQVKGNTPFWDALTTMLSLVAQYLVDRKMFENWYVWIVVDIIYVPLFYSRGYYPTSVLFAIYLALCIPGILAWRKSLIAQQLEVAPHPGPAEVLT